MPNFFLGMFSGKRQKYDTVNGEEAFVDPVITARAGDPKIAQLNPKGLAALSALYAEKDGNANQPIIADGLDELQELVKLINTCAPGTKATVVCKCDEYHKTVINLEKEESKIKAVYMDSVGNQKYIPNTSRSINNIPGITIDNYVPIFPKIEDDFGEQGEPIELYAQLQVNDCLCGVFAFKMARVFISHNHDDLTKQLNSATGSNFEHKFHIPNEFLKMAESGPGRIWFLDPELNPGVEHENNMPNKKNASRTLKNIYEKYPKAKEYIYHFASKHIDMIREALRSEGKEILKEKANSYLAKNITKEILEERGLGIHNAVSAHKKNQN